MNMSDLNSLIIYPVLQAMGSKYSDPRARRMLAAIAEQESGLVAREQYPVGPARGLWQFERMGGVAGVMGHPATRSTMREWCIRLIVPATTDAVYEAIQFNDQLACVAARMLLYADPYPLPVNEADGWETYLRAWKPGKPRPRDWPASWAASK